jgi:nucleotide-binding universal stress UspA family protein
MQQLLLPVDGSPSALRATKFLIRLIGGQPGAQVLLLNVQPAIMVKEISVNVTIEMTNQMHEQAGRDAISGAREVLDASAASCTEHLLVGDPAETIARFAKEQGVDGIVMGTRGLGSIKSLVLGSVATKVIHLVDVPVTLVK